MNLLVIGHSVLDFISDGGNKKISPGGIYYTIKTLNRIKQLNDKLFLCTQMDEENNNHFNDEFDKVNQIYIEKVDSVPKVHLNLFKDKERHEKYENITNNISLQLNHSDAFDGILINMITGFDITVEQLKSVRDNFKGIIFMDVHTLSRGLGEDYKREFRLIPDFHKWANCLDIIQVNQDELFTISSLKSELKIADELFGLGVKVLSVTKGKAGAKVFQKSNNEILSYFISAKKIDNPNVIGCGDVFGASFFYSYIKNKNVVQSLRDAVTNAENFVSGKFN